MSKEYTSISVLPATRDKLNDIAKKGTTYDQIINDLLKLRSKK